MNQSPDSDRPILAAGAASADPKEADGDYAVVPPGYSLADLERFYDWPRRIRRHVELQRPADLVAYLNEFKSPTARIFLDAAASRFCAILDHHAPGTPNWCDHSAALTLARTPEWQAWQTHDQKPIGQREFAEHLETWQLTVVEPEGAKLLEIASSLEETSSVRVRSSVRLKDGASQLVFDDSERQTNVRIPDSFLLRLKPFQEAEHGDIRARLRYRIREGRLFFAYLLDRPDLFERAVLEKLAAEFAQAAPLYWGVSTGRPLPQ